jgi:hypothetical protein
LTSRRKKSLIVSPSKGAVRDRVVTVSICDG